MAIQWLGQTGPGLLEGVTTIAQLFAQKRQEALEQEIKRSALESEAKMLPLRLEHMRIENDLGKLRLQTESQGSTEGLRGMRIENEKKSFDLDQSQQLAAAARRLGFGPEQQVLRKYQEMDDLSTKRRKELEALELELQTARRDNGLKETPTAFNRRMQKIESKRRDRQLDLQEREIRIKELAASAGPKESINPFTRIWSRLLEDSKTMDINPETVTREPQTDAFFMQEFKRAPFDKPSDKSDAFYADDLKRWENDMKVYEAVKRSRSKKDSEKELPKTEATQSRVSVAPMEAKAPSVLSPLEAAALKQRYITEWMQSEERQTGVSLGAFIRKREEVRLKGTSND